MAVRFRVKPRETEHGQYAVGQEGRPQDRPPDRGQPRPSFARPHLPRKVEEAILSGDKAAAQAAFKLAEPELARAASKGVMHRNTVSRKISRLSSRVKAVGAA